MPGRKRFGAVSGMLGVLFLMPCVSARERKPHPYRNSLVDMPVSLAVGTVTTPTFVPPKDRWYWILVQVEKPFPFRDMQCMTGAGGAFDAKLCSKEQLIDAEWTVLSEGQVVYRGSSHGFAGGIFTNDYICKFLGNFPALRGKKYVVEMRFTKDGTALNVANPHLIVVGVGEE